MARVVILINSVNYKFDQISCSIWNLNIISQQQRLHHHPCRGLKGYYIFRSMLCSPWLAAFCYSRMKHRDTANCGCRLQGCATWGSASITPATGADNSPGQVNQCSGQQGEPKESNETAAGTERFTQEPSLLWDILYLVNALCMCQTSTTLNPVVAC